MLRSKAPAAPAAEIRSRASIIGSMCRSPARSIFSTVSAMSRAIERLDAQAVVLLDVARTYYQVLRSERSVEVLKNSLNLQDARVRDFQARRRAGVVRPLDVAQTEAQASAT